MAVYCSDAKAPIILLFWEKPVIPRRGKGRKQAMVFGFLLKESQKRKVVATVVGLMF